MIHYACIKNNIVENILVFEEHDPELLQQVKETFSYDELIESPIDLVVDIGYLYDGTDFYQREGKKAWRIDEVDPDLLLEETEPTEPAVPNETP
jgi:hypothetical protein